MLKENYHTHTKRCGHAIGEDEEYVQSAIQGGLEKLGFSDHAAYHIPHPSERMNIDQVDEYIHSIESLKKKYQDQITIYTGMELECYPSQMDTLLQYRKRLDYCILGQHNLELETCSSYFLSNEEELSTYVDRLEMACESHLCDYIAHPDVCLYSYQVLDESVSQIAKRIGEISLRYNMPLELNCGSGVRYGKRNYQDGARFAYPTRIFFEEFAKLGCPIIIGLDVHDPLLFQTDKYINTALSIVEGLDLNILDHYDIIASANYHKQLL